MTTRRFAIGAALSAASALTAQQNAEPQPALASDLVRDVVGKAHTDLNAVRDLLKRERRLANACWDWGGGDYEAPLGAAAHMGRRDIAELCIENGARLDAPAVFMLGLVAPAKAMLGAFPAIHTTPGAHGIPLLSHAIAGKSHATFNLLIDAGADVNAAAWRGATPLLAAVAADEVEMVRTLLAKGAQKSEKVVDLAKRRKVAAILELIEKA